MVSFAVPALAFGLAMVSRWRNRAFAIGLVLLGVVVAVGAYPFDDPTPLGSAVKAAGSDSTVGLAMRSTNRIVPLVVLGLALLLGAGVSALSAYRRWLGIGVLALATALVVADLPPLLERHAGGHQPRTSRAAPHLRARRRARLSTPRAIAPGCSDSPARTRPTTAGG